MKLKYLIFNLLFLFVFCLSSINGETRTKSGVKLVERTYDDEQFIIYRGNSVDYRSSILIRLVDSLIAYHPNIKMEIGVIRKNGGGFKIPAPGYSHMTDSEAVAYGSPDYDTIQHAALRETHIQLKKWAVEPGDKIHIRIYDDMNHSTRFERYTLIKKHGLQGELSFPILCVQRGDDHPGTLGAGISYTGRYVHRDQRLLDKVGWGVNLSFLDFDPDQKIEIGLGFVLTFPDDIFQVGAGKNLTVNHDSGYYFFGINLFGVKEKIGW